MSPANDFKFARVVQGNFVATSLRFVAAALFLTLLNFSPAFGQSTYSDSWVDDSGTILSSGVTDGSYTHSYVVDTTLTSPNGRSAFGSRRHTGYARADASLAWDYDDLGIYLTNSDHYARCPGDDLNYYFIGATNDSGRAGASKVVMMNTRTTDSQSRCIYHAIEPCNVICRGRGEVNDPNCSPNYAIWIEPWIDFGLGWVCLPWLERVVYSDFSQPCSDT